MTLNFPGPYQLRLFYTTASASFAALQHVAQYNIALTTDPSPGAAFSTITAVTGTGGPIVLSTLVDNWVALLRPIFSNSANNTIDYCELWKFTPGTNQSEFVSTYAIALAGQSASPMLASGMVIQTYRTIEGGIAKFYFMESVLTATTRDAPPFAPADMDAIRDFIATTPRPFLGADTSYPFAAIAQFPGQNEALFKKRFRA